jgi:purine-nucleoside phosphorylase
MLGAGRGTLAQRLEARAACELPRAAALPAAWRGATLEVGLLGPARVWLVEDALLARGRESGPAWSHGFPCWLAAASGARILVHTSAGALLAGPGPAPALGAVCLACDHLNLSGASPLAGLGASALGPQFPDLTALHHRELRRAALALGKRAGIDVFEGVVACTRGPSLETPAERRWLAAAGARIAVQNLADPLLAAAHAGLAVLACACVADDGSGGAGPVDLARVLAAAERSQPALESLIAGLAGDLAAAARELRAARGEEPG